MSENHTPHLVCVGHACMTDENFISTFALLAAVALLALPILYYIG